MDARATYEAGQRGAETRLLEHDARIRSLSAARLVVALVSLAVVAGLVWGSFPHWTGGLLAVLVSAFVALVLVHAKAFAARARTETVLRFHVRGAARLDGTWRKFPDTGAAYTSAEHPFADDLDLFGPASLFQLLDATETPFGRETLANAVLLGAIRDDGPAAATWASHLMQEQEAVRELASAAAWRERLAVEGALLRSEAPKPEPFLEWAVAKDGVEVPFAVVVLAHVLPVVAVVVGLGATLLGLPKIWCVLVILAEVTVSARYRSSTAATLEAVSAHAGGFARYSPVLAAALDASPPWSSPRLQRLRQALSASNSGRGAVSEMASLERIVAFVEARRNEVFRLFIGPVLMWDLHCAVRLERWRRRSGKDVRAWFSAIGQLEAFASLAGFAFDRPDHVWPEPSSEPRLIAKGLGHPLIDKDRRIGNDVELPRSGAALVVTGSNMSGKSTLLRAIGTNVVLANMGAPVAATSFSFGFVTLATSMRIRDSLEDGVSHFYAELKKLKRVVDLANTPPPLLFLLDEILHGTNSRERIIGARAVVLGLLRCGALGAVSTHDLGIAALGQAHPDAVKNVHLEEQVNADGTMSFDYRLRDGTVQSSNALRLMKSIGLDVPLDEPGDT